MKFSIALKETPRISAAEWDEYVRMFNEVFRQQFTKTQLEHKYTSTPWGYSVHAFLYADDRLAGAYSAIAEQINYRGEARFFACGCDAMIREEYRTGLDSMARLHKAVIGYMREKDVTGFIGETHQALLQYLHFTCKFRLIGYVSNWVLPLNVFDSFPQKVLNPFIVLFGRIMLGIARHSSRSLFSGKELFTPSGDYTPSEYFCVKHEFGDGHFLYYKITLKNHLSVIHHNFRTMGQLMMGIRDILKKHRYSFRAVEMRTGCELPLPFWCYMKKNQIFHGLLLSNQIPEDEYYDLKNWQYMRGYFD